MAKEIEIPEGYEARIEGNKVVLEPNIWKRLIDIFNSALGQDFLQRKAGLNKNEVIAYLENLEKRKDEGPLSTEETEPNSIAFLEQMGYTCVPPGAKQQPTEWSEEDETFVKDAIEAVENYYSKGCGQEELVTWLKSLPERFNLQPKQEWSEGTKKALDEISDYLKYKGREEDADFIRHLRPQPKAEWTIKDAKPGDILTTGTVTFIFKSVDKDGFVSMYCSYAVSTTGTNLNLSDTATVDSKYVHPASIEQRREFLEELLRHVSSQPHWKPSEEQMEALRKVTYKMGNSCFGKDGANDKNLHSLYVALKKLLKKIDMI